MDKETSSTLLKITGIIAAVILISLISILVYFKSYGEEEKVIEVQGSYQITKESDTVWMSLGIETNTKTAKEAEAKNKEISNRFYKELEGLGLTQEEYKTESYNIYPNKNWEDSSGEIESYTVTHVIKVQTPKIDLAGSILDSAVQAGINSINGVYFDLSENAKEEARAEALKQATESARKKAESIAEGLGTEIKGIKRVSDSSFNYYPLYRDVTTAEVAEKGGLNVVTEPGSVDITATVSVLYEIK